MILYVKGDLFQSPAQVLVNAVNTVGVMGKGIALEFKRMFPDMFHQYRDLCEAGKVSIGTLWLYKTSNKWILNFPTKQHWRHPSRIEYIEAGLSKFAETYSKMGIHSIAFPPIGCGNGQLDFATEVQPLMEKYLRKLPIEVFIYPERKSDFVEHRSTDYMRRWLRTEPQNLPFAEVWDDLRMLLAKESSFETLSTQSSFTARIITQPPAIEIIASKHRYVVGYETLLSFWQQLRTYGFTMRHIAPGIVERHLSYIIPIFARLDYVGLVTIADEYDNLHAAGTGLQLLPLLPDEHTSTSGEISEFKQFSLL
jgi:O-acetyl-ADP-ribose deacetylase (regulator of RNase III)